MGETSSSEIQNTREPTVQLVRVSQSPQPRRARSERKPAQAAKRLSTNQPEPPTIIPGASEIMAPLRPREKP
jgi:hypothetical protein